MSDIARAEVGLREAALPLMEDLYEVTHENVQLAVRDDDVVFVERFAGRDAVAVHTEVGGRFAPPPTGVGLVLLAHAPVEVQSTVVAALSIVVRGSSSSAVRSLAAGVRAPARGISRTLDRTRSTDALPPAPGRR